MSLLKIAVEKLPPSQRYVCPFVALLKARYAICLCLVDKSVYFLTYCVF